LENTIQLFSRLARSAQPPHGLTPANEVARLTTSPKPMSASLSMMNPGRRTLRGSRRR
jgi:hypothetical protein